MRLEGMRVEILSYRMERSDDQEFRVEVKYLGRPQRFRLVELLAMLLTKVKSNAESCLLERVHEAVISVPSYFNAEQRDSIQMAARLACLEILCICTSIESIALHMYAALEIDDPGVHVRAGERTVVILDLGASSFNAGLVVVKDCSIRILAYASAPWLGGDEFASRIRQIIVDWMVTLHEFTSVCSQLCRESCEQIPSLFAGNTRDKSDVSEVAIVGTTLSEEFNADLSEASGLAVTAAIRTGIAESGTLSNLSIYGALPASIGIGTFAPRTNLGSKVLGIMKPLMKPHTISSMDKRVMTPIAKRHRPVAGKWERTFFVRELHSPLIKPLLYTYEGEQVSAKDNTLIGEMDVESLVPNSDPETKLRVAVEIKHFFHDIRFTAKNLETELAAQFRRRSTIKEQDVDLIISKLDRFQRDDDEEADRVAERDAVVLELANIMDFNLNSSRMQSMGCLLKLLKPFSVTRRCRSEFLRAQDVVLSKFFCLEKGIGPGNHASGKEHAQFGQDEPLPFRVVANLGGGAHGVVDKVVSTVSDREYARKLFRKPDIGKREARTFVNELKILKRINHEHCVELIGSYSDPKYFALIMTPVADCDLENFYMLASTNTDEESLLRGFFGCLAGTLDYLHQQKVIHQDVKPQNILVKGHRALLTDFGISRSWEGLTRGTTTADMGRTWIYAAREVARGGPKNQSADVWSLGCVFLEMCTVLKGLSVANMRKYFSHRNESTSFHDNIDSMPGWMGKLRGAAPRGDDVVLDWVTEMLQADPDSRLTPFEVFGRTVSEFEKSRVLFCGTCCLHGHNSDDGN
ncbi:hypothetical protein INS49_015123 [Diaporthe citri]|uniref:uncharacterized protein n=1 Tax=Diaporthe citri TaxID=83186 RepID=UPI001C7FD525|nr:uncharacterized protein INS49_015123 [Diaporthe citri]KAG6357245.1 hypothetical protein INS49_015123 [Diaporthe citri]